MEGNEKKNPKEIDGGMFTLWKLNQVRPRAKFCLRLFFLSLLSHAVSQSVGRLFTLHATFMPSYCRSTLSVALLVDALHVPKLYVLAHVYWHARTLFQRGSYILRSMLKHSRTKKTRNPKIPFGRIPFSRRPIVFIRFFLFFWNLLQLYNQLK